MLFRISSLIKLSMDAQRRIGLPDRATSALRLEMGGSLQVDLT